MKKKISLVCLMLLITLSGCNISSNGNGDLSRISEPSYMNSVTEISDIYDNSIVSLEHYGAITQTDDSVIYSKLPAKAVSSIAKMDYFRYNFESKETIKLGTVKDWEYAASYDNLLYDNHVYMFITTGDIYTLGKKYCSHIYDIDLNSNAMSKTDLKHNEHPYGLMTATNGKLYIMTSEAGNSYLNEYDIQTKKITQLRLFSFDNAANTGEVIRHLASDENRIYLLRLKMETEANVHLYVDYYDLEMNFLHSVDISDMRPEDDTEEDSISQLRQLVAHFNVKNDYICYENFSMLSFLSKIKNNTVKKVIDSDFDIGIAAEAKPDYKTSLCYQEYDPNNTLYLLDTETGQLKKGEFNADNDKYHIAYITKNTENKLLIYMDYRDPDTGEKFPSKIYYVNLHDIEFKSS